MKTLRILPLLVSAALLAACSSAQSDWNKAAAANTTAAYQDFLKQHPGDAHAQEARDRLQRLNDDHDWSDAQKANTLDAYQHYLQAQPNGSHAEEARAQVASLERSAAWQTAHAAGTVAALQEFLQKYAQGPEADQAHEQLKELQGYRVELASFKDAKHAEKSRDSLKARLNSELPDIVVLPASASNKLNRVASGPMTEADAQAACTQLKKRHQHCEVIKA